MAVLKSRWHMSNARSMALLCASTIMAAGYALPAQAQSEPGLRPSSPNVDSNGVDLPSGKLAVDSVDLTQGAGVHPISLVRRVEATTPNALQHNFLISYVQDANTGAIQVQLPTKTKNFTYIAGSNNQYQNVDGTGEQYDGGGTYTDSDGVKYFFGSYSGAPQNNTMVFKVTKITYPDGYVMNLTWDLASYMDGVPYSYVVVVSHLTKVEDNIGQSITFSYKNNSTAYPLTNVGDFNTPVSATVNANGVAQQSIGYNWSGGSLTATSSTGAVKTYTANNTAGTYSVSDGQANFSLQTYPYNAGMPSIRKKFDYTAQGVTTTYTYTQSGTGTGVDGLTVHAPGEYDRIYSLANGLTAWGRVNAVTVNGVTTSYTYDSSGRVTDVAGADGVSHYDYDARGNVTLTRRSPKPGSTRPAITTQAGYVSSCASAACNLPVWTRDAGGNQTDYSYDTTTGQILTMLQPAPDANSSRPQTSYAYQQVSGVSVPVTVTRCAVAQSCPGSAQEQKVSTTYDAVLRPINVTTASGDGTVSSSSAMGYDARGNMTSLDGPQPGNADTTVYRYDAERQVVGVVSPDPDGGGPLRPRAQRITRDAAERVTKVETGNVSSPSDADWAAFSSAQQLSTNYDGYGRKALDTLTAGGVTYQVTQYSYDSAGRSECVALRMNSATWGALPASACVPTTPGADGPDRISRTLYDANGQWSKEQLGYGTNDAIDARTAAYDATGQMISQTDAVGNKTSYAYDDFGRPWRTYYPVAGVGAGQSSTTDYEEIGYDDIGRVVSNRLRDGTSVGLGYDNLGRMVSKTPPGSELSIGYSYDLLDRVTSVARPGDGDLHGFGYDALGRVTSETQPNGSIGYQYEPGGALARTTWSDGFYVGYDYYVTGEIRAIRENGAISGAGVLASYDYDDLGRRVALTRGNGTVTSYGYDGASRLASLGLDLGGGTYDVSTTFSYNPASQLRSRSRSNVVYAWNGYYNVDRGYGVNGLNQLINAGGTAMGYDARGNLNNSGGDAYGFTSDNLLKSGPGGVALKYDSLGRLSEYDAPGVTRFVYDGDQPVSEVSASNVLQRRYVFGPGDDAPLVWYEGAGTGDRRWLHADERGSIVAVTDASGNVVGGGVNRYDDYGIPGAGNLGRFQYTGQMWLPELGMYHYKARTYSPTLGRFLQPDPAGDADGLNLYAYVGNDPVNSVDPTGMFADPNGDDDPGSHIVVTGAVQQCRTYMVRMNGYCVIAFGLLPHRPYFDYNLIAKLNYIQDQPVPGVNPNMRQCYTQNGIPVSGCDTPKVDPEATKRRNKLVCRLLKAYSYNTNRAWNASANLRNPGGAATAKSWGNADYRNAENFLYAADIGMTKFEVWARQWIAKPFWLVTRLKRTTSPSVDAAQAGYDGVDHYRDTKTQLAGWCNAQQR